MNRRFSVVIPCYNHGNKIKRAVHSCLSQTLSPHEIIIVDDGSDESTKEVLKNIRNASGSIKCITLLRNSGVSAARNVGMQAATGDFISFLDSDDAWHPKKLEILNRFFDVHNNRKVAVFHDVWQGTEQIHEEVLSSDISPTAQKISLSKLILKNPITPSALTIPVGLDIQFRADMRYTEDYEFVIRLAKRIPIMRLRLNLTLRDRPHGATGGLSGEIWKMRKGEIKMYWLLCKSSPVLFPVFPFLAFYSLAKHLRKKMTPNRLANL